MKSLLKTVGVGAGSGVAVALIMLLLFTQLSTPTSVIYTSAQPLYKGYVIVEVRRNGELIYTYDTHNIIVTIGAQYIRDLLTNNTVAVAGAAGVNVTKYIAMSADTSPAVSWTKLPNEITGSGLARQAGAISYPNATAYWANATWTATGSATVSCTGLHRFAEAGSDNNLVAAATISQATLIADDQITIKWLINVQQG